MEILDIAKVLIGQPVSVLLLAALILIFTLWRKDAAQARADLAAAVEKNEEQIKQYETLLREALGTLTRVGDMLRER